MTFVKFLTSKFIPLITFITLFVEFYSVHKTANIYNVHYAFNVKKISTFVELIMLVKCIMLIEITLTLTTKY